MILVDTSVWVDLLGLARRHRVPAERLPEFATCPVVIQEVLQGIRNDLAHQRAKEGLLSLPRFGDQAPVEIHLEASEIYRLGRRRGVTIRSSTDCLIAATALRHQLTVWHADRDFDAIARFTGLKAVQSTHPPR
jgi:predicted nucleic acid-binding protein